MSHIDIPAFPLLKKIIDSRLFELFLKNGFEVRFVGGCVRDALLGVEAHDIDLATTATPQEMQKLFDANHMKWVPTGIEFGTLTLILDHTPYQITTLREDWHSDGRHAYVNFGTNWQHDAARRDFTINALYADVKGDVFDYFKGLEDLKEGRVRFIGSADERIEEDYLRILRFFRFYSRFGKIKPDSHTLVSLNKHIGGLEKLSLERITDESRRLFANVDPSSAFFYMAETEVFQTLYKAPYVSDPLERLVYLEKQLNVPPHAFRRMVLLDIAFENLKLSNQEKHEINTLKKAFKAISLSPIPNSQDFYFWGQSPVQEAYLMKLALTPGTDPTLYQKLLTPWVKPTFPLTGHDLMENGYTSGPELGKILKQCETWWVSQNFEPTREQCLTWIKEYTENA